MWQKEKVNRRRRKTCEFGERASAYSIKYMSPSSSYATVHPAGKGSPFSKMLCRGSLSVVPPVFKLYPPKRSVGDGGVSTTHY